VRYIRAEVQRTWERQDAQARILNAVWAGIEAARIRRPPGKSNSNADPSDSAKPMMIIVDPPGQTMVRSSRSTAERHDVDFDTVDEVLVGAAGIRIPFGTTFVSRSGPGDSVMGISSAAGGVCNKGFRGRATST
jgi:hypothetical protein